MELSEEQEGLPKRSVFLKQYVDCQNKQEQEQEEERKRKD